MNHNISEDLRAKDPTILCGKNTHKTVYVGQNTKSVFRTQRETRRCSLIYKVDKTS